MSKEFYVDIHCHPTMKPFGKSFSNNGQSGHNNFNRKKKDSIWHYNPPSFFDKVLNQLLKVTKFSQSDLSSCSYGNMGVICASLYPIERNFCRNKLGTGIVGDLPQDFVTGFGINRINAIQAFDSASYCSDLQKEYDFLKELDNSFITLTDGRKYKYKLVRSYTEMDSVVKDNSKEYSTIAVIITIEGMHALGCGIDGNASLTSLEKSIKTLKDWEYPPFFVTFAHHFYNELCGHAESLSGILKSICDQSYGINTPFSSLGLDVLRMLLDEGNGKRILIDIKHMSEASRNQYFDIVRSDYAMKIPIIVSHGCVQGTPGKDAHKFNTSLINFSDKEIVEIAKSGGLFGIQLDERRIGSDKMIKYARSFTKRSKVLYYWAELVWNQIQHIAEVLDANGLYAWNNICLGTDYDGIVDPINGYWSHEDMPDLETHLLMHAHNYLKRNPALSQLNKIHEEEIVAGIMSSNAVEFFKKHF